ncbi:MAG: ABC transporter permease [bacterium]|nr:ABC transporter permease [bacterium]
MGKGLNGIKIGIAVMFISLIIGSLESVRLGLGCNIFTYGMDIFAVSPYLTEEMKLEPLTWEDARAIADIPGVRSVDSVKKSVAKVLLGSEETNMNITMITPNFVGIIGRRLIDGRNFRNIDFSEFHKVVLLPENTKNILFSKSVNPLGSEIYINRERFIVVGILGQAFMEKIINRFKLLRDYLPMISQLAELIYPKRELVIPLYYDPYDKLDAVIITVYPKYSWGTFKTVLKDEIVRTLRFRHIGESDYEVFNLHERLLAFKVYLLIFLLILFIVSIILITSALIRTKTIPFKERVVLFLVAVIIGEFLGIMLSRTVTLGLDIPPSPVWCFLVGFVIPLFMWGKYGIKKTKL